MEKKNKKTPITTTAWTKLKFKETELNHADLFWFKCPHCKDLVLLCDEPVIKKAVKKYKRYAKTK